MRAQTFRQFFLPLLVLLTSLACNYAIISAPTPFVFPTPNLTMTALFQQETEGFQTASPTPPQSQEITPSLPVEISPVSPSATALPQTEPPLSQTPLPPTSTFTPTQAPTISPSPTHTLVPTQSFAGPGMRANESVVGVYFSHPPDIDGEFDEWGLDKYQVNHVVYGAERVRNSADLSANLMVGWDKEYLYLAMRIRDDVYAQNASGEDLFKGDSLEILLDREVAEDFYQRSLSSDDFQLGISPGSPEPGEEPEAYLWYPRDQAGSRDSIEVGIDLTNDGYRIEVAIPWDIFDIDNPRSGQHYGFGVSVSDNDNGSNNVQQSMVSNLANRRLTDPTTWGDLTLVR